MCTINKDKPLKRKTAIIYKKAFIDGKGVLRSLWAWTPIEVGKIPALTYPMMGLYSYNPEHHNVTVGFMNKKDCITSVIQLEECMVRVKIGGTIYSSSFNQYKCLAGTEILSYKVILKRGIAYDYDYKEEDKIWNEAKKLIQ